MKKTISITLCLLFVLAIGTMIFSNIWPTLDMTDTPLEPNTWPKPDLSGVEKQNTWPKPDLSMNPIDENGWPQSDLC